MDSKLRTCIELMRQSMQRGQWEQEQTHASLVPYMHEELAEFEDALQQSDEQIIDELSDLLLHLLFHCEIAQRRGAFGIEDVAQRFIEKRQQRQPYLFDGSTHVLTPEEEEEYWQKGKHA